MVAFKIGRFGLFWNVSSQEDSEKARAFVKAVYDKRGGPTPDFKRVYGRYLDHKRERERSASESEKAAG